MIDLLQAQPALDKIAQARKVFFFFDFDGTLAPIVSSPDRARLPGPTRELLLRLAEGKGVRLGIISGRPLADICRRAAVRKAWYAGSHGMELLIEDRYFWQPLPEHYQKELSALSRAARKGLAGIRGLVWERKPTSLAVHYRRVSREQTGAVKRFLKRISFAKELKMSSLRPFEGKAVMEYLPREAWDKGRAVDMMLEHAEWDSGLVVYVGDDVTDEAAFAVVRETGIAVRVGSPRTVSLAGYFLRRQSDVRTFLSLMVAGRQRPTRR